MMATQTQNFGFVKPNVNDLYDVQVQNENWEKVDQVLTKITYGTEDLVEGVSELPTGTLHLVYE